MSPFQLDWRGVFGDAPPLSFAMRDAGAGSWVRFHSLPDSKRYAENPQERRVILERANAIAGDVLGDDPCWLVQAGDEGWPEAARCARTEFGLEYAGEYAFDETVWQVFAARTRFRGGAFDPLLTEIADDRAFRTLWFSPVGARVFAPYDGGFDVFAASEADIDGFRRKHPSWLSSHPLGL